MGSFFDRVRGKLPAQKINEFAPASRERVLTFTGEGAYIPLVYGRVSVPGHILKIGTVGTDTVYAVGWCLGEIEDIEQVFIGGEAAPVPNDVRQRHYRGTLIQGLDDWLAEAIPGFTDRMIISRPEGDQGIAYSVIRVKENVLDAAPTFQAIIKGRRVSDPRSSANGDAQEDYERFSIHFTGANNSTNATDDSLVGSDITFYGTAKIQSNELVLPTGTAVVNVDHNDVGPIGANKWGAEVVVTPGVLSGFQTILERGWGLAPNRGFCLYAQGSTLKLSISSNGTDYDIADQLTIPGTLTNGVPVVLNVEFTGQEYIIYVNGQYDFGVSGGRVASSVPVYEPAGFDWTIGATALGANQWPGSIKAARLHIGRNRFLGPFVVSAANPFTDSTQNATGRVYTDTTALCAADLASNPVFGGGATVAGSAAAADWNEALVNDSLPRSRLSLAINNPRRWDEHMDLLGEYGEFLWLYEGDSVVMIPDKPGQATAVPGADVVVNGGFNSGAGWDALPSSATVSGGVLVVDGSQGSTQTVTQDVPTVIGTKYTASFQIVSRDSGNVAMRLNNVSVINVQTQPSIYSVEWTATSTSTEVQIRYSSAFEGSIDNVKLLGPGTSATAYPVIADYVRGSLRVVGLEDTDTPTSITVRYSEPSSNATWEERSVTQTLPGVASGDLDLITTTVRLPGVYRIEEATLKAQARLLRMINRTQVSFIATDEAIAYLRGAIITLSDPAEGVEIDCRIMAVDAVDFGRYRVTADRYSPEHYPSEITIPTTTGTVPVGAIVATTATVAPSGWSIWSDANGKHIVGAGGAHDEGDTGGSATYGGFSGNTTFDGTHTGGGEPIQVPTSTGGTTTGTYYLPDVSDKGNHRHSYSTGTITPNPMRREYIYMKKTGSAESKFPASAHIFGARNVAVQNLVRIASNKNRLIAAASAVGNAGDASKFVSFTSGNANNSHNHHDTGSRRFGPIDFLNAEGNPGSGGGNHSHDYTLLLDVAPKRKTIAMYSGLDDFIVAPGMIVLWEGGALPAGWVLCDGNNGTEDYRNYFLTIAADGGEGVASGDNTLSISGRGSRVGHDHGDNNNSDDLVMRGVSHADEVYHDHEVSDSGNWTPEYYALSLIMFTG